MIHLCTITTPLDGPSATLCPQCSRILPDAMFRRLLTPAQAAARGFRPIRETPEQAQQRAEEACLRRPRKPVWQGAQRVYATWRLCRDCDPPPKRKTLKTMTSRELYEQALDNPELLRTVDVHLKAARQREKRARSESAYKRWEREWRERWHFARQKLRVELRTTTDRLHYLKKNPPRFGYEEGLHFFDTYRAILRDLIGWFSAQAGNRQGRGQMRMAAEAEGVRPWQGGRGRPPKARAGGDRTQVMDRHSTWGDYLSPAQDSALRQAWAALPPQFLRSRVPHVLLITSDDDRLCLAGYGHDEDSGTEQEAQARRDMVRPTSVNHGEDE